MVAVAQFALDESFSLPQDLLQHAEIHASRIHVEPTRMITAQNEQILFNQRIRSVGKCSKALWHFSKQFLHSSIGNAAQADYRFGPPFRTPLHRLNFAFQVTGASVDFVGYGSILRR